MKFLKKALRVLLILIVAIGIGLWLFTNSLKPDYNGTLSLNNLKNTVEVYYDDYGIPHIYAENELDAQRALGYVHAQDRLWQMELIRRIAAGRLSEVFGEQMIKNDMFFSSLGIEEAAATTIKNLDKDGEVYQLTTAYLDGINQYIENGPKPLEFYLVGLEKEKYTLKDVYNVIGYMSFSFAHAHKTDPVLTEVKEKLGSTYLKELGIDIDSTSTVIRSEVKSADFSVVAKEVAAVFEKLPIPSFIGSNSWVIGPEKTKNGKVIFANDPHIGFSQPAIWYQAHMVTPDYEMYGYHLALTPFPLLGHNRQYAYGLTMFPVDDLDFYYEDELSSDPQKYQTPEGVKPYEIQKKRINVKGQEPVAYDLRVSDHGPIVNDVFDQVKNERSVSMDWIYTKFENKMLHVAYTMSHANSLQTFQKAPETIHAPGLNVMYGDADGNIAWYASAKIRRYKDGVNSKLILSAKDSDTISYLNFDKNPKAINPSWHYVYSANNQPDSINGIFYPGYYQPDDRAKRIEQLLEGKSDFTKNDVMSMINDVTSSTTPTLMREVFNAIDSSDLTKQEKEAVDMLQKWDGTYAIDQVAPTIYSRFLYEFLQNTYRDEMGETFFTFLNTSQQKKVVRQQMMRDSSVWWDNVETKNTVEDKKAIVTKSIKNSVAFLNQQLGRDIQAWTWNKVHTLEHPHPMGQVEALRNYFNVGPFEVNGGKEVINNLAFKLDSTGFYKVNSGPSTRRVIDFSDVENSMSISPTGQSGNLLSDYYKDQAKKYVDGDFVRMEMNKKRIQQSKNKLVFKME
ncbi:penicillin acylase family protein [Spongiivirga sp. MCCC 1A20706]|uniref:penicillin acylase family protein n=1 Tax=Spongiivirga sp. MCCC 1A20706 TaxID=3160963 RepID=UPI0039778A6A